MGFATLIYNASAAGVNASNLDMVAATDPDFSQRNSHYIFTEPYRLLGAALVGASVTRGRYQVPHWNAIGETIIFNANRALQPPSNPQWDWYIGYPSIIPMEEEFQVQVSNNLGASTEIENCVLQLITEDWSANIPRGVDIGANAGKYIFPIRVSFTVTPTLNAWSGPQILTFSQSLRGGVYAVVGGVLQGSNSVAWRVIFPRYRLYHGRKLRPGGLIQNAIGDVITNQWDPWVVSMGEWGRFQTFEPPTIEVFGTAAASTTYQGFLWVSYLGEDDNLLSGGMGGGM
jgi:hypothetical protein